MKLLQLIYHWILIQCYYYSGQQVMLFSHNMKDSDRLTSLTPRFIFRHQWKYLMILFSFQWWRRWSLWGVSTFSPCWSYSGKERAAPQSRTLLEMSDHKYPSWHIFIGCVVEKKETDHRFKYVLTHQNSCFVSQIFLCRGEFIGLVKITRCKEIEWVYLCAKPNSQCVFM